MEKELIRAFQFKSSSCHPELDSGSRQIVNLKMNKILNSLKFYYRGIIRFFGQILRVNKLLYVFARAESLDPGSESGMITLGV